MKVLVINASANKERSTTLKLTITFLEGLGIEASEVEFVTTIRLNINPCRACYACWFKTSGMCVQKDDATTAPYLAKVKQAGAEYKAAEKISDETQAYLDTPMLPAEAFVKTVNGIFEGMMKKK